MTPDSVPQPSLDRMVPVPGHPLVVGITLDQPDLVPRTALAWSKALGGVPLYVAFVDESRVVDEEFPDGTVRHSAFDPDELGESWHARADRLQSFAAAVLDGQGAEWHFRYLAGRADRALTHLARAVDASALVVGARRPRNERVHDFVSGSIGLRLARHQHRPVLVVPLSVVDWKAASTWR